MTANAPGASRLSGLDGLRALAVAGVIADHLALSTGAFGGWAVRGRFGVTVFFVLSGFLITHLMLAEETRTGTISLPRFYARRAFRILPPAVAYLAVIALLMTLGAIAAHYADLATSLLFVRNYFLGADDTTAHFWSLSVEEQFYLAWPLLLVLLPRRARLPAVIALLTAVPFWKTHYIAYVQHPFGFDDQVVTPFNADALLVGCLLALLRSSAACGRWLRSAWLASLFALILGLALVGAALGRTRYASIDALVWTGEGALVGVALIINTLIERRASALNPLLDAPPVAWLGRISYSLYLWQQLFCKACPHWWAGRPPQGVLLALAAAAASYYLIEQPALRLRDRLLGRRTQETHG
jgi:peptidoglycan/LPS O-acetylase OafA/YrhL